MSDLIDQWRLEYVQFLARDVQAQRRRSKRRKKLAKRKFRGHRPLGHVEGHERDPPTPDRD